MGAAYKTQKAGGGVGSPAAAQHNSLHLMNVMSLYKAMTTHYIK